jgi:LacI family transcriptional regulator
MLMAGTDAQVPGRVTLTDVAHRAGVSPAAASLALRGKRGVGDDTRKRVLASASELGYQARGAAPVESSNTIGLLVKSRPIDVGQTNAFYGPVIAGINEACTVLGIDMRLDSLAVDEHFDPIEIPRLMDAPDTAGLLVLGAYLSDQSAQMLGRRPVVLVDGYTTDPARFSSIVSDNLGGAAAATRHLVRLGHERIALVGTSPDAFPSILDRRRGYQAGMAEAGLAPRYIDGHHDDPLGCAAATVEVMEEGDRPTALVAANDAVALELVAELRDLVPHRLSVVGFDDIDAASMIKPRLDTVAIDKRAMGRLAVSLLRHRIDNPGDPAFVTVQRASLVIRETSAPPP